MFFASDNAGPVPPQVMDALARPMTATPCPMAPTT